MVDMQESQPLLGSPSLVSSRKKPKIAAVCILFVELCERTAYYGLVSNFVVMLTEYPLEWTPTTAASLYFVLTGLTYAMALIGGWIADSFLGKFKTMTIFMFLYILGYLIFPLIKWDYGDKQYWVLKYCQSSECANGVIITGVVFVGMACGGMKANIAPFGADQIEQYGGDAKVTFFNWFYWAVNVGSLLAMGPIAYIQQDLNFGIGLMVSYSFLVLGFVIFLLGRFFFNVRAVTGSVLTTVCCVLKDSCVKPKVASRERNVTRPLRGVGGSAADFKIGCLDRAKLRHGGRYSDHEVDNVKLLGRVFLVFLTIVPFWIGYLQIPVAWLTLFDVVLLIVLLPVMSKFYSFLSRAGYPLNVRKRIIIGFLFGIGSVVVAGCLETLRLKQISDSNYNTISQVIGNTTYDAADVSVFWQIPQYLLMGVSEAFASVASLELAYTLAPKTMQSIIMGFYFLAIGIASGLGIALVQIFSSIPNPWFSIKDHGNINYCHLDYYFYFIAGLILVGLVLFVIVVYKFNMGGDPSPVAKTTSQDVLRFRTEGSEVVEVTDPSANVDNNRIQSTS